MRRAFTALLGVVAGLASLAIAAELACRVLPVSSAAATGYYIDPLILTYPPGHRFRAATGWDLRNARTLHVNNLGFASTTDFTPDARAVALIGDSYVEASMLPEAERLGPQLQRRLGRPVYAMGAPGTALLDYAERIRLASQRLGVRDFVLFIEPGDVRQSLCGSGNIHGPCLRRDTLAPATDLRPAPSGLKRWVRESAFAQYLFSQLRVAPERLLPALQALPRAALPRLKREPADYAPPAAEHDAGTPPQAIEAVAQAFFERARPWVSGRLVLVLESRRRTGPPTAIDAERRRFAEIAVAEGATVVDMAPAYREHAARSALSLNVGPYDGHLNRLGLGLVAGAAADALQTAPPWPGAGR